MFCAKKFNKRLTTWGDKLPRNADISYMFGYKKWDIVKKIAPWYYKLLKKQTINSLLGL
jgi:hypothetical protein